MQLNKGILIVIEGIDGSGKSTLAQMLAAGFVSKQVEVVLTKEPGATGLGAQIRSMVQTQTMTPAAQYLLFAADRAQHFSEVVLPALAHKKLVISDRMGDSSLAYQGYGNGLDLPMIDTINRWTMHPKKPDLVIYLDVEVKTALSRVQKRGSLSTFEKADFLMRVKKGFDEIFNNRADVLKIDSNGTIEKVYHHTFEYLWAWLIKNNYLI